MSLSKIYSVLLASLTGALCLSGCAEPHFTGLTPSSRTFNELPSSTRDYYVGVNANFSVGQPDGPQGAAGAAAAQAKSTSQPALLPSHPATQP